MKGRILVVDDEESFCRLVVEGLRRRDYEAEYRLSGAQAVAALGGADFDVVLTDLNMPGMVGTSVCEWVVANRPDVPVILITAFGNLDAAVAAIRAGAYDFINKPVEVEQLAIAIDRALRHRRLDEEVRRLRREVAKPESFEELIGASPPIQAVFDLLDRISDSEATVLVTGESGTGKELVARALHRRSRRRSAPFVAVSGAAIPESLIESQLFGHVRGAFTGAVDDRPGLFRQAEGGTLFLDEIADLPLPLQPRLLRVLQERTVRPVGGDREVPVDLRVVSATNRDLESAVAEERFREDLYFRVNVVRVEMPPLRSRGTDTLRLAEHFVTRFATRSGKAVSGIASPAAQRLLSYDWPGNVRELQNAIERAVAVTRFDRVTVDDLPDRIRAYRGSHVIVAADDPAEMPPLEEVERRYIRRVLQAVGGNRTEAARILGLDRKTLYRKLKEDASE